MKNFKKSFLFALFTSLAPLVILSKPSINKQKQENLRYNIQIPVNIPEFALIQQELSIVVNKIVKKELGLKRNYTFNFFRALQNPHISVYFVGDISIKNKEKDIIHSTIASLFDEEKSFEFNDVHFSATLDFFGFKKNTLVMMVNDEDGQLAYLNQEIKKALNQAHTQYRNENNVNLYNKTKSEEFSYHPHISMGWISIDAIKERIKDKKQTDKILEKIRQEILKESQLIFNNFLNNCDSKITIDTLSIFDLESRTDVKEYKLCS